MFHKRLNFTKCAPAHLLYQDLGGRISVWWDSLTDGAKQRGSLQEAAWNQHLLLKYSLISSAEMIGWFFSAHFFHISFRPQIKFFRPSKKKWTFSPINLRTFIYWLFDIFIRQQRQTWGEMICAKVTGWNWTVVKATGPTWQHVCVNDANQRQFSREEVWSWCSYTPF